MNPLLCSLLAGAACAAALKAQDPPTPPPQQPAPTNWKDFTKSGLPIKFYGYFRLDAYYNTARMDSVVIPTRVLPESPKKNDDQFHLDPRLTRFGFDVTPGEVAGSTVVGKLEIDFANYPTGVSESRATPRIRLAYLDVSKDELAFRAGQDWDVVSPLFPAVNGEMLMWNAGNTGDRRPQMQGRWKPKDSNFDLKACLGMTGAVNNQDLDTGALAGERDGFDSGMPQIQARAGCNGLELVEKKPSEFGLWGMWGQTETDTAFNGNTRFETWLAGIDVQIPLTSELTLRGEVWTGSNLGDVRGGIGQTINTTTGDEIASTGGWGEVVYAYTPKTKFHAGGTVDDPDNDDLNAGNAKRNLSWYGGTIVDWDSGVRTGFDVIYWATEYAGGGPSGRDGNTVRFDLYFQYNF